MSVSVLCFCYKRVVIECFRGKDWGDALNESAVLVFP